MRWKNLAGWLVLLAVWTAAAWQTDNDILLPSPLQTVQAFAGMLADSRSYTALAETLWRVGRGLILSLAAALISALACRRSKWIRGLFHPIRVLTKTIPNISYMILAIIWLGSEGAVTAVSFMVLFPMFFNAFLDSLDHEDEEMQWVAMLYRDTWYNEILYHDLPALKMVIITTVKTAASFGFKVGIMAEIIGSVRSGVGRQMHFASINLDTPAVFAWTLLIILVSALLDLCFDRIHAAMVHQEKAA
jgi:NitT/TauT family transport system permease protein